MSNWSDYGVCKDHDPNLWFSPSPTSADTAAAVALCGTCPVREECLTYSLEWGEEGVWGGLTAKERRVIRRERGVKLRSAA